VSRPKRLHDAGAERRGSGDGSPGTPLEIALVPLARSTFDTALAGEALHQARESLEAAGFRVLAPDEVLQDADQVEAQLVRWADATPDLMVVLQATFADATIVLRLADRVDSPLLLWALPETPEGGRLRLNSLCGVNLAGHSLHRRGRAYDFLYAPPTDPSAVDKVRLLGSAARLRRRLQAARLGRLGAHPDGFDTCVLDAPRLAEKLGVEVVPLELDDLFRRVERVPDNARQEVRAALEPRLAGLDQVDRGAADKTLAAYLALRDLCQEQRLDALAIRCWPEFFVDLGCAACGAMSLLGDAKIPASCESDPNGAVTQLMLHWASGGAVFDVDVVSFDVRGDSAVVWHCGKAPLSMADPISVPRAAVHSNRRIPLLMEFPLKPGRITLARLSQANRDLELVTGTAEVLRAPLSFSGTSGVVRFDRPAGDVLDALLARGLEHHLALTYGNHVAVLKKLAQLAEIPTLEL
jgi:L-fucose isomerase-like protein